MQKPDESGGYDMSAATSYDTSTAGDPTAMIAGMMGMMGIIWLVIIVLMVFIWWKIFSKAGYNGLLSLLMLVPIANLVLIIWFAFADWPVRRNAANAGPVQ